MAYPEERKARRIERAHLDDRRAEEVGGADRVYSLRVLFNLLPKLLVEPATVPRTRSAHAGLPVGC